MRSEEESSAITFGLGQFQRFSLVPYVQAGNDLSSRDEATEGNRQPYIITLGSLGLFIK